MLLHDGKGFRQVVPKLVQPCSTASGKRFQGRQSPPSLVLQANIDVRRGRQAGRSLSPFHETQTRFELVPTEAMWLVGERRYVCTAQDPPPGE